MSRTMIPLKTNKPAVSPRDCALLFGIPIERESFVHKLEGPRDGNFAESFRASTTELAWTGYRPLAERLSNVAAEAEKFGVRVSRSMTLEGLAAASLQRQVTVISHSRSPLFRPADLVDMARIREHFSRAGDGMRWPIDAAGVAHFLNSRYFPARDKADQLIGAPIRFQVELAEIRRRLTDQVPDAFRGGAGVEFADGFQPFEAIAAQFPTTFDGVIDLIVCNSLLPAELLRNRCSRSLVIATSDLTFPETRLPLYVATISLLARHPRPYDDAVEELKVILRKEFA
jgi:hypothetical protein